MQKTGFHRRILITLCYNRHAIIIQSFHSSCLSEQTTCSQLFAVATGLGFAGNDKMPKDMFYGMYALRDRYSMDQVPLQNRGAKHTVEYKGKR